MAQVISEKEFSLKLLMLLNSCDLSKVRCVTGPGRSGAIASVYTSHILGVPFVPFGQELPDYMNPILIIDTACSSGKTLRRAERKYSKHNPIIKFVFKEPPRVKFWYENIDTVIRGNNPQHIWFDEYGIETCDEIRNWLT